MEQEENLVMMTIMFEEQLSKTLISRFIAPLADDYHVDHISVSDDIFCISDLKKERSFSHFSLIAGTEPV